MRDYALYIQDRRYTAPNLLFAELKDDKAALRLARERLGESRDHTGVKVIDMNTDSEVGDVGPFPPEA